MGYPVFYNLFSLCLYHYISLYYSYEHIFQIQSSFYTFFRLIPLDITRKFYTFYKLHHKITNTFPLKFYQCLQYSISTKFCSWPDSVPARELIRFYITHKPCLKCLHKLYYDKLLNNLFMLFTQYWLYAVYVPDTMKDPGNTILKNFVFSMI